MNKINEVKMEGSISIQARIDLKCLASLDKYWMDNEVVIKSMSQLVGWSMELCLELLVKQGVIGKKFDVLTEAHSWMVGRELYQKSMKKRGIKKLVTAIGFEELRANGVDPKDYARSKFGQMHNANRGNCGFEAYSEIVDYKPIISDDEWERVQARIKEEDEKDAAKQKKDFSERLSDIVSNQGVMNNEVTIQQTEYSNVQDQKNKVGEVDNIPKSNNIVNDSSQIRKMTEEEVKKKEKELVLKEIEQKKINDQMMFAPKRNK